MQYINNKLVIIAIIIVILLFIFVRQFSKKEHAKNNTKSRKYASKSTGKPRGNKWSTFFGDSDAEPDTNDSDDDNIEHDAKKLYKLIHEDMVNNMTLEEFTDKSGDLGDNFIYMELKQLYNNAENNDKDSKAAVTLKDYIDTITKIREGDD